jgi:hypothetical protein
MSDTQHEITTAISKNENESSKLDDSSQVNAGASTLLGIGSSTQNENMPQIGGTATTNPVGSALLTSNTQTAAQTAEQRRIGSFPGDLSTIKPIFSLKSKNTQAKERFTQKAQEYLDSHKMSIYLQDAIKIILDRREEKPIDLLTD